MKLKQLIVSNFQSLKDITFDFPNGLVLIDGWNEDLQTHNGVGKSALLNAITYAIYGKTPKNITLGNLVRQGTEYMTTAIELEVDGKTVGISRSRGPKKGNVNIKVNGEPVHGLAKDIEDTISDIVGLSFVQFVQVVYIFQGSNNRFVSLNDTEKKKFLSALLSLEDYDRAYKSVHSEITNLELELSKLNGIISGAHDEIARIDVQREDAAHRMKEFRTEVTEEVVTLSKHVDDIKSKIDLLKAERSKAMKSPALSRLLEEKSQVEEKLSVITEVQTRIFRTDNDIENEEKTLKVLKKKEKNPPDGTCEACDQKLPSWDLNKYLEELKKQMDSVGEIIKRLTDTRAALSDLLNKEPILRKQHEDSITSIANEKLNGPERFDGDIKAQEDQLQAISNQFKFKQDQLKMLEREEKKWIKLLVEAKDNLKNAETTLKTSEVEKRLLLDVKKVFSPTGVKAFVFDGIIRQLNTSIARYLSELSGDSVRFEFFSDDSKGKFTEVCEYMGVHRDVNSLSGGEFRRLSLAVDLALSDVVCSRMSVYPTVLFLDE